MELTLPHSLRIPPVNRAIPRNQAYPNGRVFGAPPPDLGSVRTPITDFFSAAEFHPVLGEEFLSKYVGQQPNWGPIGYVTYKRTYARPLYAYDLGVEDDWAPDKPLRNEEFWETLARVTNGMWHIIRCHSARKNIDFSEDMARSKARQMFERMWAFKWLPPGRGLWMMGTRQMYIKGSAALQNCLAYETEVITSEGTRRIGDLAGQTVTLLTEGGKWVDAPINSFGVQTLMEVILSRQGVQKRLYATPDHRWIVKSKKGSTSYACQDRLTRELQPGNRLAYSFGQGIKGSLRPSAFGIAHGITFGDGNARASQHGAASLTLCGEKDQQLGKWFPLSPKSEYPEKCTGGATVVADLPRAFKALPDLSESRSYLYGWLAGYFAADGTVKQDGQVVLSSINRDNLAHVREVCYLLGIGTYGIRQETRISNLTKQPFTMYQVTLMRDTLDPEFFLVGDHRQRFTASSPSEIEPRYWNVVSVRETSRAEEVFCAVVPETHSFTLADNILTGNCGFRSTENIAREGSIPFTWAMDMSMLGVGVGFDTKGAGKTEVIDPESLLLTVYVVPDTREGWVEATGIVIDGFLLGKPIPKFDYSLVRPKGAFIRGFGGVAEGPEPLMKLHQDLIAFFKRRIGSKLTSADIVDVFNMIAACVVSGNVRRSAQIALGDPTDWDFISLKHYPDQHPTCWNSNNSVFAKQGMDYTQIAELIATKGEPGLIWLDNIRKYSRMGVLDNKDKKAMGVNPCVPADTWVMTQDGPNQVKDLVGTPFNVLVDGFPYQTKGFFSTGVKQLKKIETSRGYSLRATGNHKVRVLDSSGNFEWKATEDLVPGNVMVLHAHGQQSWQGTGTQQEGLLLGNLLGDGHITGKKAKLEIWDDPGYAETLFSTLRENVPGRSDRTGTLVAERKLHTTSSVGLKRLASAYSLLEKKIGPEVEKASSAFYVGFLQGWFYADGSVQGSQEKGVSVRLSSISLDNLQAAQRMLARLGIKSTIYQNRREAGERPLPDGKGNSKLYPCQACHELVIANENLNTFAWRVGFPDTTKRDHLKELLGSYKRSLNREMNLTIVTSVTDDSIEEVFDLQVPGINAFDANGLYIHNCGEQALEDQELCCLVENFPSLHTDENDFFTTLKQSYLYAKSVTLVPCHSRKTNRVMGRNMRIGCSITGIQDARMKFGTRRFLDMLKDGYTLIQERDELYSDWLQVRRSIKTTSGKPSGTISKLPGVKSGSMRAAGEYYINRIRFSNINPIIFRLAEAGYIMYPDTEQPESTVIVDFYVHDESFDMTEEQSAANIWEQLEFNAALQEVWADNQMSITIKFLKGPNAAKDIASALELYETRLKAISFLPFEASEAYDNPPFEPISKEEYLRNVARLKPYTLDLTLEDDLDESNCGAACPTR